MKVYAIDPGTTKSGWVIYEGEKVCDSGVADNHDLLRWVQNEKECDTLAIEMIASYGMAVGKEVFETVKWIGRFQQAWKHPEDVLMVYRKDVKLLLCGTPKAKDANIRQAIIDMYEPSGGGKCPQIGTKAIPGPLYGVSSHAWPALAVAITASHGMQHADRS